MNKLFVMLAMVVSFSALANQAPSQVDVSKLTAEQAAQIQKQVQEMQQQPTNVSQTVRKEAEAWGELGANMGKAMIGAAKEVGVAANEFAGTTLGKITVAIVAYKIIGQDILSIVMGSLTLLVGTWIAVLVNRKYAWNVTYETKPILWGALNRQYVAKRQEHHNTGEVMLLSAIILVLTWVVGLNIIL